MTRSQFSANDKAADILRKLATDSLGPKFNGQAQGVIRRVKLEMTGRPRAEIFQALTSRLRAVGIVPNDAVVRQYAQAISDGTLTD
jgi:hypothetical protein